MSKKRQIQAQNEIYLCKREMNIQDADIRNANVRKADVQDTDVQDTDVRDADVQDADVLDADVKKADDLGILKRVEQFYQEKAELEQFNNDIIHGLFYVVTDVKKNNQVELKRMETSMQQIKMIQKINESRSSSIDYLLRYYHK